MLICARIFSCFSAIYRLFNLLQLKCNQANHNIVVALAFILLVLLCTILHAIVLNPDYVTLKIMTFCGDDGNIAQMNDKFRNFENSFDSAYYNFRMSKSDSSAYNKIQARTRLLENGTAEKSVRRLPHVVVVGVRRCGTRPLIQYLNNHPNIVVTADTHFFDNVKNYQKGLEWYRCTMPYSFNDQLMIETTESYFHSYWSPARIQQMNSTIRIIIVVREPVSRAVSEYLHYDHNAGKTKPFEYYAIKGGKVAVHYPRIQLSQYYFFTKRWLKYFTREQIHFVNGDTLLTDPATELRKVELFLRLTHNVSKTNFYHKYKGELCWIGLDQSEHCYHGNKHGRYTKLSTNATDILHEFFKPFNQKFFNLIGQDFGWMT